MKYLQSIKVLVLCFKIVISVSNARFIHASIICIGISPKGISMHSWRPFNLELIMDVVASGAV